MFEEAEYSKSEILYQQTSRLYEALKTTLPALLLNAIVLVFILWPVIDHSKLLVWLSLLTLLLLGRGLTAFFYRKTNPQPESIQAWFRYFLLGSVLTGLLWGCAAIWLFPYHDAARQVFLAFVIGGVAAGAITSLSFTKSAIYSYLFLLLIPLLVQFAISSSELSTAMDVLLLLYTLVLFTAAKRSYDNIRHGILLTIKSSIHEQHMRQSEDRFRTLLETATDAFYLNDLNGRLIDVNQQACRDLGYSHEELLFMSVADIEADASQDEMKQMWASMKKGEHFRVETHHRRKDGSLIPVELSLGLIEVDNQAMISALARDISDRKRAEKVIRESQQHMALHIQNTPLGVIEWDRNFCVREWNPAAEKIFGYSKDEVLGRSARELIIPQNVQDHVDDIWGQLLSARGGLRSTNANITKNGELIKCDWYNTPLVNDQHEVIGVASLVQDVTEQVRALQKIRESEANYWALFELSNQANMTLDEDKFLDCNNATLRMFGFKTKKEFLGKHPGELSPPFQPDGTDSKTAADKQIDTAFKEGKNFFEWVHRRSSGEDFPAEVLLTPMILDGQHVLQAVVFDISERKQNEAELIAARKESEQANKAKTEFLSSMSHELRTPLNSILGFCQLLEMKYEDEQLKSNVAEIHKAGSHLLELINEVLDLSKIEAGKLQLSLEDYSFSMLLTESLALIQLMATKCHIKLVNEVDNRADYKIHVDYTRYKQALLNLLSNAIKYNSDNGTVTVSCEVINNNRLRVYVRDTGNGLTEKQKHSLFRPFERLKEHNSIEGTGIGLVITRHLVEMMGGEIGVDSQPGKGSVFWVDAVLSESGNVDSIPAKSETESLIEEENHKLSGKTILYIEDTPANLLLVKNLIEEHTSYTMISAYDATLGLLLAEEKQPDLILMDINLPGMNGYEALKALQHNELIQHIPVVAISANAMPADIEKGRAAGFLDYITKPVDVKILLSTINQILTE